MKEKNIRRYPPIFVSVIVAVVFFAISASAIAGETNISVRAVEKGAGITYAEKTEVLENVFTASTAPAPIQTEEIEAAQTYKSVVQSRDWGAEESEMLLRIAMAEAEGESVEGKALVMLVVLNRVWSDKFPDTIEEVIFQPRQFSPAVEGGRYYTTEPNEECYEALKLVMSGWDESYGALYFESCEGDSLHSRNLEFLFQVGNHKFYR